MSEGLQKQDSVIADSTGSCTWEMFQLRVLYKLLGMVVRTYQGKKYLSIPRDDFHIEIIDDIGEVDEEVVEDEKDIHEL